MAVTLFEKIWQRHVVAEGPGGQTLLYVDRHLLHEGDAVTFDADLPHHFENPGKEEAVLLAVVSAGLRRS